MFERLGGKGASMCSVHRVAEDSMAWASDSGSCLWHELDLSSLAVSLLFISNQTEAIFFENSTWIGQAGYSATGSRNLITWDLSSMVESEETL